MPKPPSSASKFAQRFREDRVHERVTVNKISDILPNNNVETNDFVANPLALLSCGVNFFSVVIGYREFYRNAVSRWRHSGN